MSRVPFFSGPRSRRGVLLGLALIAVGIGAAALHLSGHRALNEPAAALESNHRSAPAPSDVSGGTSVPLVERAALTPSVERVTTMKRLRELAQSDPATALGLALAGNLQSPGSPDAPERGWIICRSLVNLERFPEAVAEARVVLERYPGTPWALDVERHLLVNPLSDPSERGYGRRSDLE